MQYLVTMVKSLTRILQRGNFESKVRTFLEKMSQSSGVQATHTHRRGGSSQSRTPRPLKISVIFLKKNSHFNAQTNQFGSYCSLQRCLKPPKRTLLNSKDLKAS